MKFHVTEILLASGNKGKVREFKTLLKPLGIELHTLEGFPEIVEPEENGNTFLANAELKATHYAVKTGMWSMADDSGLEIDHLGGRPGVFSARYGGVDISYEDKMRLLLSELTNSSEEERGAQFVSVIALADPSGLVHIEAEGICRGTIADAPRGSNGFGYDPIFIPAGFALTFGEMTDEEKRGLSHRGKASAQFIHKMSEFTGL